LATTAFLLIARRSPKSEIQKYQHGRNESCLSSMDCTKSITKSKHRFQVCLKLGFLNSKISKISKSVDLKNEELLAFWLKNLTLCESHTLLTCTLTLKMGHQFNPVINNTRMKPLSCSNLHTKIPKR
jgi:hypothetical protein